MNHWHQNAYPPSPTTKWQKVLLNGTLFSYLITTVTFAQNSLKNDVPLLTDYARAKWD